MFADFFDFDFDRYFFNRCGILDQKPFKAIEKDGKLMIILNTLGISTGDIHVDIEESSDGYFSQYLKISGKTMNKITEENHNINMRIGVRKPVGDIAWESADGLTYLEITFKEPVRPKVTISNKKLLSS